MDGAAKRPDFHLLLRLPGITNFKTMAGDWIKMRMDLHRHPKVVRIMSALNADRLRTIGGLHAVWCLFDEQSEDGVLDGYTPKIIDDMIGWPGFCAAVVAVGWLSFEEGRGLVMPDFEAHNGSSAKRRASEAERKRTSRKASASCPQNVRTECGQKADQRREEKRREDMTEVATVVAPTEKPEQSDSEWLTALATDPTYHGIDVKTEHGKLCRWCEVNRKQPTRRRFINWLGRCEKPMTAVRGQSAMPVLENLR